MGAVRNISDAPKRRRPPATTPEARERQLIAKAYDEIERRIDAKEATAAELLHFAKGGSRTEKLHQEKMEAENHLLEVKRELMESQKRQESLFEEALEAFRSYSPGVSSA